LRDGHDFREEGLIACRAGYLSGAADIRRRISGAAPAPALKRKSMLARARDVTGPGQMALLAHAIQGPRLAMRDPKASSLAAAANASIG
jgi:hypothetical protein